MMKAIILMTVLLGIITGNSFAAKIGEEVEPGKLHMSCVPETIVGPLGECLNSGVKCNNSHPFLLAQINSNECKNNYYEKVGCYCVDESYEPPKPKQEYELKFCTLDNVREKMKCERLGCASINQGIAVSDDPTCKERGTDTLGCYCPKD